MYFATQQRGAAGGMMDGTRVIKPSTRAWFPQRRFGAGATNDSTLRRFAASIGLRHGWAGLRAVSRKMVGVAVSMHYRSSTPLTILSASVFVKLPVTTTDAPIMVRSKGAITT